MTAVCKIGQLGSRFRNHAFSKVPNLPQCTCQFGMHAVFFIPYVEPQCRSECWVDVNHDSDLIWIPPDLFSLSQKTCSLAPRVFLLLSLCCHAYRLPSPCTVIWQGPYNLHVCCKEGGSVGSLGASIAAVTRHNGPYTFYAGFVILPARFSQTRAWDISSMQAWADHRRI